MVADQRIGYLLSQKIQGSRGHLVKKPLWRGLAKAIIKYNIYSLSTCRRDRSTHSLTAGHMAPLCLAKAARASSSLTLTPGASLAAAARTPAHRLGQRSLSHASGATGFCASAACTSAALKPSLSASLIKRANSSPLSASRLDTAPARASRDMARLFDSGSGDGPCNDEV